MTLSVCLDLLARFKINPNETFIEVTASVEDVIGTSAELEIGDKFTIWELFFGLMLPSGNDAAI